VTGVVAGTGTGHRGTVEILLCWLKIALLMALCLHKVGLTKHGTVHGRTCGKPSVTEGGSGTGGTPEVQGMLGASVAVWRYCLIFISSPYYHSINFIIPHSWSFMAKYYHFSFECPLQCSILLFLEQGGQ
jgi:hypothetical protein